MTLNILFPQWQDTGKTNEVYFGAKLGAGSINNIQWVEVPVEENNELVMNNDIWGYDRILIQQTRAKEIIEQEQPEKINLVGGGCGAEIMPVSYLNSKYPDLQVIWFDAHGDLNTPQLSPSKLFHGMPLRLLLEDGDEGLRRLLFSTVKPRQVQLCGVRDLDEPEKDYIKENNIAISNLEHLVTMTGNKLYIHLDLDVLNLDDFDRVKCPTPGGIGVEDLIKTLKILNKTNQVVGFSMVEFVPEGKAGLDIIKKLMEAGICK